MKIQRDINTTPATPNQEIRAGRKAEETRTDNVQVDTFESNSREGATSRLKNFGRNVIEAGFRMSGMPSMTFAKPISGEKAENLINKLKPGDILLMNFQAVLGWRISEKAAIGTDYGHVAMYTGDGKIIHADGAKVAETDLKKYITNQRLKIDVVRPEYKTTEDKESAIKYITSQLKKPYDSEFKTRDDSSHYCSELVMHALENMPNPINLPAKKLFGTEIISPNVFKETGEIIHSDKDTFLKTLANGTPAILAYAIPIAALGALATVPVAGIMPGIIFGSIFNAIGSAMQRDAARKPH